jgi:hypothetical protein
LLLRFYSAVENLSFLLFEYTLLEAFEKALFYKFIFHVDDTKNSVNALIAHGNRVIAIQKRLREKKKSYMCLVVWCHKCHS